MKKLFVAIAVGGMAAGATAAVALPQDLLGQAAAPQQAQRTSVITPTTRYVNVTAYVAPNPEYAPGIDLLSRVPFSRRR